MYDWEGSIVFTDCLVRVASNTWGGGGTGYPIMLMQHFPECHGAAIRLMQGGLKEHLPGKQLGGGVYPLPFVFQPGGGW